MAGRTRLPILLAAASLLAGCGGGGGDGLSESDLRACLAEAGVEISPASAASPTLGNASPDFSALVDEVPVDLIVERDADRARRTSANVRGALATYGVADADQRLLEERNAIAVFAVTPSEEQRQTVAGCMD